MASKKKPSAALPYLDASFFEHSPKLRAAREESRSAQEIGRAVYDLRVRSGLSAAALARAAGMTRRTVEKLENGECTRAPLVRLRLLAAALGTRVELRLVADDKVSSAQASLPVGTGAERSPRARKTARRRAPIAGPVSPPRASIIDPSRPQTPLSA